MSRDMVDRARHHPDTPWHDGVRRGPCQHCGRPCTAASGRWPHHDDTGEQVCR